MRSIAIIKYIFATLGLAFLIGASLVYINTSSFVERAVKADGIVVDMIQSPSNSSKRTYKPVVEFTTANGEKIKFTSPFGSRPPRFTQGENVRVFYDASNPSKAKIDDFMSLWGMPVIFGILGGVFFLVGGGIILTGVLTTRRDEYLRNFGTPVITEYQSVELNRRVKVNRRNPFRILTKWRNPATSEIHIFKSHNLWSDPTSYIKSKNIMVYVDLNNPKKYYVDVSFLQKVDS